MTELRRILEAILFVAEHPVSVDELAQLAERPPGEVRAELETMRSDHADRGIVLREVGGGWRLYSHPDVRPYLERFAASATSQRLSRAALETLAVVAYRQPVSRGQVSEIRGVDSEQAMRTLERHEMIVEVGRARGPGQALLYGTTPEFLERVGVNELAELPPLADHIPPADVVEALERPFRPEDPSSDSRSS